MCYEKILSLLFIFDTAIYERFAFNMKKEYESCTEQDGLSHAMMLFQSRLTGTFAWDMTEYYIWVYNNVCRHNKDVNNTSVHIIFYDHELLHNFRISDTYEYSNLLNCSYETVGVQCKIENVTKKHLLRRELVHGIQHGKLLQCDSQYEEPFSGWNLCSCVSVCCIENGNL